MRTTWKPWAPRRRSRRAVLAKRPLGAMGFEAVELADQTSRRARGNRPGSGRRRRSIQAFRRGRGMRWASRKGRKSFLEIAADAAAGVVGQPLEADADDRRALVAWVALEERRERDRAVDPEVFHLPERALGRRLAFGRGEVEDGSGRGGGRDPVVDRALVVGKHREVAADRALRARLPRHRHVRLPRPRSPDPPKRRRRSVTQHRSVPGSEHRRHPPPPPRDRVVPDRVDAGDGADADVRPAPVA